MKNLVWTLIKAYLIVVGLLYHNTFKHRVKDAWKKTLADRGHTSFIEYMKTGPR